MNSIHLKKKGTDLVTHACGWIMPVTPFRPAYFLSVLLLLLAWGCAPEMADHYQGYIEADYLLVSSVNGGILESLDVRRGSRVKGGQLLFRLDPAVQAAAVDEALQELQRAENRLADLSKGDRPSELAAVQARLAQARTMYELARIEYERRQKLYADKVIARELLDRTQAELERSAALIEQLQAELTTAELGGRPDAIAAARAEVEAARARLTRARWQLDQQTLSAPESGLVFDTFYVPGEYVPPSFPVVSILPPGRIFVRFFVPEPVVSTFSPDREVIVVMDGTDRQYRATVTYVSPQAEYTPPVIYSRNTRSKLVYMIEAHFDAGDAAGLHPGQPVDVLAEPPHA